MLENEIVFHSQRRFLQSTEEQKSAHISNFKLSNANPPMTLNIAFVEQGRNEEGAAAREKRREPHDDYDELHP